LVAFAAGGPTDVLARLLADALGRRLGQSIVVDNRGGAGGNIGYGLAASAAPDGYTLAFADPSITVNASLYKSLPFDVERDFVAIGSAFRGPTVVVVPGKSGILTLADLVKAAKAKPGKLNYGSAGNGTPPHLNAEVFKSAQGLDILHVPYRGAAPAMTDLIAGRVDVMFLNIGSARSQIESGELRGLAVSGSQRAAALPDVPTFKETGLPLPALDPGTWWGLIAPVKLPATIHQQLTKALDEALADPELRKRAASMSIDVIPSTGAEFATLMSEERRKWAEVVARAKIEVE
jgi:tripartite-type tricarboxylate transporter receptor subunit TctC